MPSKKILEQKKSQVDVLAEKFKKAKMIVFTEYRGITVEDDTKMRKALREAGVKYVVVKNSLTDRACKEAGFDMGEHLKGMTAIAISANDPIAAAKVLKEYDEKIESFKILAGYLDGKAIDANTVNELASIPPKEVLIGKVLGSLQSSLYGLAYALQAIVDKKSAGEGEAAAE